MNPNQPNPTDSEPSKDLHEALQRLFCRFGKPLESGDNIESLNVVYAIDEIEQRAYELFTITDEQAKRAPLEKIAIPALKLAYSRGHYCDQQPCPGCEAGYALEKITGRSWTQEECADQPPN